MSDFGITEGVLHKYRGNDENVIIPDGVTRICEDTFFECITLENVTIPAGVTQIPMSAFAGCTSLTSVTIPDSVSEIGMFAFSDCGEALIIYGKSGSNAEAYALEEGIEFRCI